MDDEELTMVLAADNEAPQAARQFAASALSERSLDHAAADVQLVLSELVSNAVMHTDSAQCVIGLRFDGDRLRIDVYDFGEVFVYVFDPDPGRPSGLGLAIVGSIAKEWGIQPLTTGKSVWCEVSTTAPEGDAR